MKASILTIGTELTTGQIADTNSAWIARQLTDFGIQVDLHETVADDKIKIQDALERCAKVAPLLFVCGGLGPTTDDFTRDVLADWSQRPLQFDQTSFDAVTRRLELLNIPVVSSQRQQCFFPEGATILNNREGTASGFFLRHDSCAIWVFPGPPHELAAIWSDHLPRMLSTYVPQKSADQLFSWHCLGKSEAELGELTEKALEGSGFRTGYRASFPLIEIKVWTPSSSSHEHRNLYFDKLEENIHPWMLYRGERDLLTQLLPYFTKQKTLILDYATNGVLAGKFGRKDFLCTTIEVITKYRWESKTPESSLDHLLRLAPRLSSEDSPSPCDTIAICGYGSGAEFCWGIARHRQKIALPYGKAFSQQPMNPSLESRRGTLVAELFLSSLLSYYKRFDANSESLERSPFDNVT